MSKNAILILALWAFPFGGVTGQDFGFLHTELRWRTIETPHFLVHYHEGAEWTAQAVAVAAESAYVPLTTLYRHTPDQKVSFVIKDHDDYSNGAAYFFDNRIEIWAPAMDFELRGIHPWVQNVVTHELTHIIQIQTAMKLGRRLPAFYLQWFGYESERRPDVLYGFPNVLVSYPFSFFLVPSWFAEGAAQYNHPSLTFDYWDSHRDMILRMHVLDGTALTWEEMAVFGKTSLGNESAYNAGFSLVEYIAETYGVASLEAISRALGDLPRLTIDGAIEKALGKKGEELFEEWRIGKEQHYRQMQQSLEGQLTDVDLVEPEGFGNAFPVWSPDGRSVAYVSNKGSDYFGESSVYLSTPSAGTSRRLVTGVRSSLTFHPDGESIFYSKITSENPHWSRQADLYRFDLGTEKETRLTRGLRAMHPSVSPDGTRLVFTFGSDGTLDLGTCSIDGSDVRRVTNVPRGHQVYTPRWSPDGKTIVFGYSTGQGQAVATVAAEGGDLRLVAVDADCRNPVFSPDGSFLYYVSDRTGIFNIYALELATGRTSQVTNVLGGAFSPSVNGAGEVVFASYTSTGFKIALLRDEPLRETVVPPPAMTMPISIPAPDPAITGSREYRNVFTSLSLIPFLRVDNYNPKNSGLDIVKPGLYGMSYDVLEKLSLFGGAAINRKLERDLFLIFEVRDKLPLVSWVGMEPSLSLELYNISRKTTSTFTIDPSPVLISPEITYNLFEFTASLRQPVFRENMSLRLWYTLGRYSADIGSFVNPNPPITLVPAFRNTYFIGNSFNAQVRLDQVRPGVDREINPVGRTAFLRYGYETNKFNPEGEYEIEAGVAVPQYDRIVFHRLEAQWNEHLALPWKRHTLTVGLRGAGILGKTVDSFFDSYAGGMLGMKGYPFYALGGNTMATASLTYRFPIATAMNFRILQFSFTKLYGSVFADVGNAWTGSAPPASDWRSDAGFELRLESFSFYAYPTRFFFSGAYGFDRFEKTFAGVRVPYGGEWRFYFGVLFGFELGDAAASLSRMTGGLR